MEKNVILVTGSNGGLGSAVIEYLLSTKRFEVLGQYRSSKTAIEKIYRKCNLEPDQYLFKAELTNEHDVARLHSDITSRFGQLYGLVNLAGGSINAMSWKMTVEDYRAVVDQNLMSAFLMCRQFGPDFRAQSGGRIVNISSVVASIGVAGASVYAASKAAVEGYSKSLSLELAKSAVTVNTLALGYYDSGIIDAVPEKNQEILKQKIPLGEFGKSKQLGGLIEFLMSEESAYLTGAVIPVDGGLS